MLRITNILTKNKKPGSEYCAWLRVANERLFHFDTAIERQGLFVAAQLRRTLFTVADDLEVIAVDTLQGQVFLDGVGAAFPQRHVVLAGPGLVGMAFEANLAVAAAQALSVGIEGGAGLGPQHGLVEFEVEHSIDTARAEVAAAAVGRIGADRASAGTAAVVIDALG